MSHSCVEIKMMTYHRKADEADGTLFIDVPKSCQRDVVYPYQNSAQKLSLSCLCSTSLCNEVQIWVPVHLQSVYICELDIAQIY